jgi:hypothetical protein
MATPRTELNNGEAKAASLPPGGSRGLIERALLVAEIVAAYRQARRELRRAPIQLVMSAMRADTTMPQPIKDDPTEDERLFVECRRLAWIVARTLKLMPGDTRCLARSLVLTRLLARRGIPTTLVIGARTTPSFLAHAWVEYDGEPVLSPGDGSFSRLVEL